MDHRVSGALQEFEGFEGVYKGSHFGLELALKVGNQGVGKTKLLEVWDMEF